MLCFMLHKMMWLLLDPHNRLFFLVQSFIKKDVIDIELYPSHFHVNGS